MIKIERERPLILVVDDFKATLLMVRKSLEKKGYDVMEAENGAQAIQRFQEELPDVVLMDIEMPVMDGLTATKWIKKLPKTQQRPVLIFTGTHDEQSVEEAFEAGADDFITKPINWEELAHRVGRLFYLKEMEETIAYEAYYDKLTNLPNRILYMDRLAMALAQAGKRKQKLAVLFLNIRDFKSINDAFGYDEGDLLLSELARRIQNCVDENMTLARLDGDRFAVIIPLLEAGQDPGRTADCLMEGVSKPCCILDHEIKLNCSMGLALYPDDGLSAPELLTNAEAAMYRAAQEAGNAYRYYDQQMNRKALNRLSLKNKLHQAMDKEEFIVYYQPLIDVESGEIVAAESLLRWQSSENELKSPAYFIPRAEETGLILPIGDWVLKEVCVWGRSLQDKGYDPLVYSVNLSALQFKQKDLLERIQHILGESGLAPEYLKLEITESLAMEDLSYTIRVLESLKDMGIKVSIDDFGTGYSSLNALKNLPLDELKIDITFIRDIVKDPRDRLIVEAIIALGRGLGVNLVAEGVEEVPQMDILKEMGCHQVQGYLFSKPVPPDIFSRMLIR